MQRTDVAEPIRGEELWVLQIYCFGPNVLMDNCCIVMPFLKMEDAVFIHDNKYYIDTLLI